MSREAIERTIADLREHGDVLAWQDVITYGYTGPYFEEDVRRITLGDIAGRVEANVADIIAENERLKKELAETKEALKPIDDVYIPDYGICDTCYDRSECKGPENSVTCEWHDIVEAVQKAKSIIGGWSWTRITEKG